MDIQRSEMSSLIEGQRWKLWVAAVILGAAGAGFLLPDEIGGAMHIPGVFVELGALALCVMSFGWAIYSVRCRKCSLRLVSYAMSHQGVGQWLNWLLFVKRCPKCGADHAGKLF